jgi:hypothetical protein
MRASSVVRANCLGSAEKCTKLGEVFPPPPALLRRASSLVEEAPEEENRGTIG